jgi:hypothetical protein
MRSSAPPGRSPLPPLHRYRGRELAIGRRSTQPTCAPSSAAIHSATLSVNPRLLAKATRRFVLPIHPGANDRQERRIIVEGRGRDVVEHDLTTSLPRDPLDVLDRDLLLRGIGDEAAPQGVPGEVAGDPGGGRAPAQERATSPGSSPFSVSRPRRSNVRKTGPVAPTVLSQRSRAATGQSSAVGPVAGRRGT